MKPLVTLVACCLLAPPALVAASDYPPPMGPYRTPATLEFLADQARAILDTLGPSGSESPDTPERHHPGSVRTFALDHTATQVETPTRAHSETEVASGSMEGASVAPPPRWKTWDPADLAPVARELPAFTQYDPADAWTPPPRDVDSEQRYAQAPMAGWQPATDPYTATDGYPGSFPGTDYYTPAPTGQGQRDPAALPSWQYPSQSYRESFPLTRQDDRRGSPDGWPSYPVNEPPASSPRSGYYRPPSRRGQAPAPKLGTYSPGYPPVTAPLAGSGAYPAEPLSPRYPGITGDNVPYYGVAPYPGPSQEADPYRRGQPAYAPEYNTNASPQPPLMSAPTRKASYSRDLWPSSSGYPPQSFGSTAGEGPYRPVPQEHRWDYDAEYRRGYVSPGAASLAGPDPNAAAPSFRYREIEPTSSKIYYGDYEFAPLPRSPGETDRQTTAGQPSDADRWYGGGGDYRPVPGQFRSTSTLPRAVTGPEGQVYHYRPLEKRHSSAPNARTWEPASYGGPQDYPGQSWAYPEERHPDYRARR